MEINLAFVTQLENMTRQGQTQQIDQLLDQVVLSKTPRELAGRLAQICFRNSLYIKSLCILNPIIRSTKPLEKPPQPSDVISYASALVSLGMFVEARSLLRPIDTLENPQALLIMSFSYFGEWSYQRTIPLLAKFIANPRLSFYQQIVGKVNLAAAYVSSQMFSQAEELLKSLVEITTENRMKLLKGNSLELLAQMEIQKKNYAQAIHYLDQAELQFPDKNSIYYFFVKKWKSICNLLIDPSNKDYQSKCHELKTEAMQWRHYETSRDVDLYMAYATQDRDLLNRVMFGTPNPNFKKKVERLFGGKVKVAESFRLQSKVRSESPLNREIDYRSVSLYFSKSALKEKLFKVITLDFYKPANLGLLFSQLHSEEHFNPLTSEKRIINQIYALRDEFNRMGIPILLKKDKNDFIFELAAGSEMLFARQAHRSRMTPRMKERVKAFAKGRRITSAELAVFLKCSKRKAQMVIQSLITQKFLLRVQQGPHSKYLLCEDRKIV